jgi:F-type H+-transporting ATPase subunit a
MYPEIFNSNMFTLLAEAEVGKHFYWNIAGFLAHGQVLLVIWFVAIILLLLSVLGTRNVERIPTGFQNFMESAVDFVTDIARDQLYNVENNTSPPHYV